MPFFGKKAKPVNNEPLSENSLARAGHSIETDRTLTHHGEEMSKAQLKRATRTRKSWSLLSAFFLLISVVFLILVEAGNTKVGKILSDIYFIRLDLSQIIPASVPSGGLINTIAQTLGLHDYYQVGLWNYCEGYVGQGITDCLPTQTLYWFNPVEILVSQLLAGATSKSDNCMCMMSNSLTTSSCFAYRSHQDSAHPQSSLPMDVRPISNRSLC
jgi:hypothetical protein